MDLVDPENETSKSDIDALLAVDPLEIRPIRSQKKNNQQKNQDRPAGVPLISVLRPKLIYV